MSHSPFDRAAKKQVTFRRVAEPWTIILIITGLFQIFRGAPLDGAFFLVIAALLLADAVNIARIRGARIPRRPVMYAAAAIVGLLLVIAPRHSIAEGIIVSGIGLTVLIFAWPEPHFESTTTGSTADPLRYAAIVWSVIGVALALWEVSSFLLGLPSPHAQFAHPSISLLLDPALDTFAGRALFTALWLVAGIGLVRRGQQTANQRMGLQRSKQRQSGEQQR